MYSRGEVAFAILTIILTALALYILVVKRRTHTATFIQVSPNDFVHSFPLAYTVGLAFTNYSAKNQLSLDRAQTVLLDRTFQSGESYPFTLYKTDAGYRIVIKDGDVSLSTDDFAMGAAPSELSLTPVERTIGEVEPIKTIVSNRSALNSIELHLLAVKRSA